MTKPLLVDQPNLSLAWAQAYLAIRQTPGHRIAPLSLTFSGFEKDDPIEHPCIRKTLDAVLESSGKPSVQTVANTIFPQVLWRRAKGDRQALYAAYRESLPDFVAMEPQQNKRGLYFARLTAFGLDHKTGEPLPQFPKDSLPEDGNQLEVIIKKCKKGVLAIKLQASVFDPGRDHVDDPRLGFPCLQHVTFIPHFADKSLVMNAFYATQQLFVRGYGNYLGLARLGLFVAGQTGLTLDRLTCFVGVEKMDDSYKPSDSDSVAALDEACESALGATPMPGGAT